MGSMGLGLLAPVLPRRLRISPASEIADAMVEAAIAAVLGKRVIESAELI
jgi:hypothetical protein